MDKKPIWYAAMLDNTDLQRGVDLQRPIWMQAKGYAENAATATEKIWQRAGKAVGAVISTAALAEFARKMVSIRGEFQQLEIAFGTMLKSGDRAKKLMADLSQFAAETPFGLQSSASGAKQLIAYGSTAETVIGELRMLGDVAAGTGQSINDLVYLYGTLRTQGRAYMMDIRQFAGRGIPIYDELAKVLGTTKDKVNDFVSAGKVGFAEIEKAFKNMTSAGGMYGGLMEEQSKSVTGRIEQLKDGIDMMFNSIGKSSEGVVYKAIGGATTLVENYEKVGKVLAGLIATYGTYKAAVIAHNVVLGVQQQMLLQTALSGQALTKWQALQAVATTRLSAVTNVLNKTMLSNPYVLVATLVAGLVAAMWALSDGTTAAEKAQKAHNDRLGEAKTKFDELISIVRDGTKAITDRQAALEQLREIYPGLFNDMDIEAVKLANLAGLTKQATLADLDRQRVIAEDRIHQLDTEISEQQKKSRSSVNGAIGRMVARNRLKELEDEKKVQQDIVDTYHERLKSEDDLAKKASEEAANAPRNKAHWETQKKNAEAALEAMKDTAKGSAEWNKQMKLLNEANAKLKTWDFSNKGETDAARLKREKAETVKATKEYYDAIAKEIERGELDRVQSRIDLMQQGFEREQAQTELNYKRALFENRQREAAMVKALQDIREKEWETENPEAKKKGQTFDRSTITAANLTADQQAEIADNYRVAEEVRAKANRDAMEAEAAAMREYLIEYGKHEEKKLAITQKYEKLIAEAKTEGEKLSLGKERDKKLSDLDISLAKKSNLWIRLFADVRDMSSRTLKQVIADTKKLLTYLKTPKEERTEEQTNDIKALGFTDDQLNSLSADAKLIKEIYDELIEKQNAFEDRTNYPFSNIVKGFGNLKQSISGINREGQKLSELEKDTAKQRGLDQLKSGVVELTGFLSGAVAKLKELAEVTGDTGLGDFADEAGALLQNLGAAAQGAASGGWIGAIVGGVMDMISQTVEAFTHTKAYTAQLKQSMKEFGNEMKMLELDRMVGKNENAFGKKVFTDTIQQSAKAKEAMRQYGDEVSKRTMPEIKKSFNSLGATIFGFGVTGVGGEFAGLSKSVTNESKTLLAAYQKGYSDLEGMAVKTKSRSGWAKFWGAKDEYTSLKDLAPQLWKDGEFDIEAAKKFLETNKQLSDEQRAQIKNVIDLRGTYDEAIAAIDAQIKDMFGFLGSAITDSLVEAIKTGGDAWEIFEKKGIKAFENIGEQLAYELYYADKFTELQKRLGKATEEGTPEQVARKQADAIKEFYDYVQATLPNAEGFIKLWSEQFGAWEGDMRSATAKGIATASQDSVYKLDGTATIISHHTYSIMENTMSINESTKLLVQNSNIALQHLAGIEAHTRELHFMRVDLQSLRGSISDIATRGIPIRS